MAELRNGLWMKVRLDEMIGRHIFIRGWHQPYVLRPLLQALEPGMTLFDIGAHYGMYTLYGAQGVGPCGVVHSFEPGPHQWRLLSENVRLNGLDDRVRLNRLALSDGEAPLGYREDRTGNLGASHVSRAAMGVTVPAISLDAYCDGAEIDRIDVMKIDVEGYELPVLEGARGLMGRSSPATILYECEDAMCRRFGYRASEMHAFLLAHGYRIWSARSGREVDTCTVRSRENDFIARRNF
jgi:FkbM family methyltransferase